MSGAPDLLPVISMAAAFAAGVAGSGHCFGMCGGLAAAYGARARREVDPSLPHAAARAFARVSLHHAGRLLGYGVLGALAGAIGGGLLAVLDVVQAASLLRILTGLVIIAFGLRLLFGLGTAGLLERAGARVWKRIAPAAHGWSARSGVAPALAAGVLWGWLPCGLVYSMLLLAATTGSATAGAGTLLAFGAGTAPAMLTSGLLASQVSRLLRHPRARPVAGLLLVACGAWTLMAVQGHVATGHGDHAPAAHHHVSP